MKRIIVAVMLLLLCSMVFAWDVVRQAAFPTNFYTLEKIGNTIWAGGYVGGVAKSLDDGVTWSFVVTPAYTPPTYKDVWDIDFIDQNNGIMVGDDGMVALTTDGGVTWNWPATALAVIGETRMYGAVYHPDGKIWIAGYEGKIAYSPDFGATWSLQGVGVTAEIGYGISMNDDGIGFIPLNNGNPDQSKILSTNDFGTTWTLVDLAITGNPTLNKIRQFGNKVVITGDKGYLGYSNDNGATWTHYPNAAGTSSSDALRDVIMNGDIGYAVGRNARILKTTDGWATYTLLTHNFSPYIEGIKFRTDGSLVACGWQGTLAISLDDGISWEDQVPTAVDLWQASIVDANTWYVAGDKGNILKTTDGGQTMIKKNVPGSSELYYACYFKDENEGFVTGKTTGKIYRTIDGGNNWTDITIPGFSSAKAYYDFFFFNDLVGYVTGVGGKVAKTIDGGVTWTLTGDDIPSSKNLYCSHWKSETNGYSGSATGALYITTNGGVAWTFITIGGSANIRDIWFRDANNGVLVKENGEIFYTTTGGNTVESWTAATESATAAVYAVTSDHNGVYWAAGYSSDTSQMGNSWALMKSLDNGATWTQETFAPLDFNATRFTGIGAGGGKIVAVGKNNLIVAQLEVPEHVSLNSPADNSTGLDPASVSLSWTPSPYGSVAEFYQVYASSSPEAIFDGLYFETTGTSFDLGANAALGYATAWYWAILPVNEILDSPDITSDNFQIWRYTTMADPSITELDTPVLAIANSAGQMTLSWEAVTDAVSYLVYGADEAVGPYALIVGTAALQYVYPDPGNKKFFKVIASTQAR